MTLKVNIIETNNASNFKRVEVDKYIISSPPELDQDLKSDFKESLHQAYDILEGKQPRRTIRDMING